MRGSDDFFMRLVHGFFQPQLPSQPGAAAARSDEKKNDD
jgi:hypothetical protein